MTRRCVAMLLLCLPLLSLLQVGPQAPRHTAPSTDGAYSNILRADYVGPDKCAECHADQHELWRSHSHRSMNADASAEAILGRFPDRIVYAHCTALFHEANGSYFIAIHEGETFIRRYRITRTVGSRISQMYIGVQVAGPEPPTHPAYRTEVKLPFGWWVEREEWTPATYFDSDMPPEYGRDGRPFVDPSAIQGLTWSQNCIWCHNTYPYEMRLQTRNAGLEPNRLGFPHADLALSRLEEPIGRTPAGDPLARADQLTTLGISCESCHFGGREHAIEREPIRFLPGGRDLNFPKANGSLATEARSSAYVINSICAQCHSSSVRRFPNGAAVLNSSEATDLRNGACASAIRCTDCHDPHRSVRESEDRGEAAANQACMRCHPAVADAPREHSAHSEAATCLDCHMPRIMQGLARPGRSHRISKPTDPSMLTPTTPNACNLCHLNKPLAWTLRHLSTDWNWTLPDDLEAGTSETPTRDLWLEHADPVLRLLAAGELARTAPSEDGLADLVAALNDPIPINRMLAKFAVEDWIGRGLDADEYSPLLRGDERTRQVNHLLKSLIQELPK